MMRLKLALLLLAALGLTALTEPWPATDRKTWPIGGEAACETNFCNCPEAAGALLCQDFEDGESDCAVSKAYGSLNLNDALLGEIGYVAGSPDCADATAPLGGTYSFEATSGVAGSDEVSYWPENAVGNVNVCENNVDCILTALLNVKDDTGAQPAKVLSLGGAGFCEMTYGGVANTLRASCTADSGLAHTLTNGVTYKVCLKYTVADDCTVAVDTEGGTWCAGALGSATVLDCDAGAHKAASNFALADATDRVTVELDNVMVVAE